MVSLDSNHVACSCEQRTSEHPGSWANFKNNGTSIKFRRVCNTIRGRLMHKKILTEGLFRAHTYTYICITCSWSISPYSTCMSPGSISCKNEEGSERKSVP